jgi:hypothetical protein
MLKAANLYIRQETQPGTSVLLAQLKVFSRTFCTEVKCASHVLTSTISILIPTTHGILPSLVKTSP